MYQFIKIHSTDKQANTIDENKIKIGKEEEEETESITNTKESKRVEEYNNE